MTENFNENVLSAQLKAFCKLTMSIDENCQCDGSCDGCPINQCIEMLESYRNNKPDTKTEIDE